MGVDGSCGRARNVEWSAEMMGSRCAANPSYGRTSFHAANHRPAGGERYGSYDSGGHFLCRGNLAQGAADFYKQFWPRVGGQKWWVDGEAKTQAGALSRKRSGVVVYLRGVSAAG